MIITIALSFAALLHLPGTIFSICLFVLCSTSFGAFFSYWLAGYVFGKDDGTPEMRAVSDPIKEGSEGFLKIQYGAITRMATIVCFLILGSYTLRPNGSSQTGVEAVGNTTLGIVSSLAFVAGATCSASVGYVSMWVSASTNIRVCSAARRSYSEALDICFRGGAFSAVLCITLCVFGVTALFLVLHFVFVTTSGVLSATDLPMLMVGFGFGASFVALFMQLGGGIYTKAADVGADMVGKIEIGIPEDDPRNPAVIADLVGDMVGDCVGSSADIFESVAAEIIGAMILGATLAKEEGLEVPIKYVLFPLCVHAVDIVVSSIGVLTLRAGPSSENPMNALTRSYRITAFCAFIGFVLCCRVLLHIEDKPSAWINFAMCGVVGICNGYIFIQSTQYYTDYEFQPVRDIAAASITGHGTNIITGMAVGLKSTVIPVISVSISVLAAYHMGAATGIGTQRSAGLFGTAVATMGMLSSAVYVLAMNNFGPIADNAGGIAEMSQQPEGVRICTDKLDACGNVTKAITKGYSIGSAALACFLLFGAFMDEFSAYSGVPFRTVDVAVPEIFIGGLMGTMMVFYFSGLAIAAVAKAAQEVVLEVRRQLQENPDIMTFKSRPDYRSCVALVTQAALKEMQFPGMLAVGMPVGVGLVFRVVGYFTNRPMLGAEALAGYLMYATTTGILMALFLDNVGGAWDNAKKYIELGNHGGKGSEAHKASVTGDTVGDPFKDTAGPSLHVLIKLLSTTVLVMGPLFVNSA
ncbi:unnamed protein product [Ectocarpus fasciculatus]